MQNLYIDNYAKQCSKASLVYMVLCRQSNREGKCYPSIKYMAHKLGVSTDSVSRGLKTLLRYNVISRKLTRSRKAWGNYEYQLLDQSVWIRVD
ncbi:helix-turn-helix domain-containing protein [Candidatus Uabimicrobium sp. HlEnr_7]|uniref:helix-turn-helix domain-containing protein n=1 Tax=Candidatus Uabimicrobium helgolandensis TaxID=3095367 RepID=UPI003558B7A1